LEAPKVMCQERDQLRLGVPGMCLGVREQEAGKRCKWLINKPVEPPLND